MPPVMTSTVAPTVRAPISKTRSAPVAVRERRRGRTSGGGRTGSWVVATEVTVFFHDGPEGRRTTRHSPDPEPARERVEPRARAATDPPFGVNAARTRHGG